MFEDDAKPSNGDSGDGDKAGGDGEAGEKDDDKIAKVREQLKAAASSTFGDNEFKCNVLSREDTISQLSKEYKDVEAQVGKQFSHCLVVDFDSESKLKESVNDKVKQYLKLLFEADKKLVTKDNAQKCFDAAFKDVEVGEKGDVIELTLKRDIEAESVVGPTGRLILEADEFVNKVKKQVTSDAVDLGKSGMSNPKMQNSYQIRAGKSDDVIKELEKIGMGSKDEYDKMREKQFSVFIPIKQAKDINDIHYGGSHGEKAFTEDAVKKLFKDNLGDTDFTYQVLTGTSTTVQYNKKPKENADMKVFVASFDEVDESKEHTIRFFDSSKEDFNDASSRKLLKPDFKVKDGKTIKDLTTSDEQAEEFWNDGPSGNPDDWSGGKWCDKDGN